MTVKVMARLTARVGSEAALASILRDLCAPSRGEAACLSYEVFHNQDDPLEFVTVEQWADPAGVDAHMATPHVALAIKLASELLAQPPAIHSFSQLA